MLIKCELNSIFFYLHHLLSYTRYDQKVEQNVLIFFQIYTYQNNCNCFEFVGFQVVFYFFQTVPEICCCFCHVAFRTFRTRVSELKMQLYSPITKIAKTWNADNATGKKEKTLAWFWPIKAPIKPSHENGIGVN